ncbi:MAG TPA: hypothetical protein VF334_20585, partial [Polyangia bacterium]
MRRCTRISLTAGITAGVLVSIAGCSSAQLAGLDDGLAAPRVDELHPALLLPSTRIDLVGAGFVEPERASTELILDGTFTPAG